MQGKLIHAVVAIQDITRNVFHNQYPERVTAIRDLAVPAINVRISYLPAVGTVGRLPGNQLAWSIVPADLLNRKCLIASAAFHFLFLRPMETDQVTHLDVRGVSAQGIGLQIALTLNTEAILVTENTALQGVMTMMNLN
jgi:hypothetical protein